MVKRVCAFLLSFIIIAFLPAECFADNTVKRYLPDLGMSIETPGDYYILSRDISSSDPALSFFGFSKSDCISFLEESSIYLDAVDPDVTTEIVVTMTENVLSDMNMLPDTTIDALLSSLSDVYSNIGISVTNMEYYQHKQAKFVVLDINQESDTGTIYGVQYYTIYDYKAINVTLHSYDGRVSSSDKSLARSVVDSVVFDSSPITPEPARKTNSFMYTDTETGTTFTVPANWVQGELSMPRDTIDVKFESTDGESFVFYGSIDAWSQMTASERAGTTRSSYDLSVLSNDDLKEFASLLGSPNGAFKRETIGGVEYCQFETSYSQGVISAPVTAYLTINNGYIYLFQYSGGNSKAHYDDFTQLLNSVNYKIGNNAAGNSGGSTMIIVLVVFVLIVVAVCLLIAKSKKKPETVAAAKTNDVSIRDDDPGMHDIPATNSPPTQPTYGVLYCPSCGREIPRGSKFCQFCGTKINLKE